MIVARDGTSSVATRVLEDPADVALGAVLLEDLENHVLGADALFELALEDDRTNLRRRDVERAARHRDGDVNATGADGDLTDATARRRVGVGTDEGRARLAEALEMELVADAVAALGVDDAVLFGDRLEEVVVVGVLETDLDRVVVDVGDRDVGLHVRNVHRLELKIGHRARRVLRQGLINVNAQLRILRGIAFDEVSGEDLLDDVLRSFHVIVVYVQPAEVGEVAIWAAPS